MARRPLLGVLGAALLLAACSGAGPDAASTTEPSATATASSEPTPTATADLGTPVDADTLVPHAAGVAWQVDGAVLLTGTSGAPLGHLPGWTIDRDASDRLAAPVLVDPDGVVRVVTVDGLVDPADGLPLAAGARLVVGPATADVVEGDTVLTTFDPADPADLWVSATGTVVGVVGGAAWDLETGGPTEVEAGCRVADRHTPEDPLLVCDDGARLAGGTDATPPAGTRFGWVTVGTTGDEVLATVRADPGLGVLVGTRTGGALDALTPADPASGGVGLFYRSSGAAWVASLGPTGGLDVLSPTGDLTRVRDVPGSSDATMWVR